MFKLRDYQTVLAERVLKAWQTVDAVLAVLATGGGKTVIFCWLIAQHTGAAVIVAHRKEILGQISCGLAAMGVRHRIVAPQSTVRRIRRRHLKKFGKSFIDANAQVGVASVQSLTSQSSVKNTAVQRWLDQVSKVVFDEGHHYTKTGFWAKSVERLDGAKILFVTATPERADGKGLGVDADGFAEVMVEGPQTAWLIAHGFASPFEYKAPATDLNVNDIPLTAKGDINTKVMRARIPDSHLVGDIVKHYFKWAGGKRTIIFANDTATAYEHERAFLAAGVKAVTLTGDTDQSVRDHELDGFEDGSGATVLINVDLFDEGFDVPAVDAVILARVTESLAKFLQMVGRSLRPVYAEGWPLTTADERKAAIAAGPKPHAVVIDAVRNWERGHMGPTWPRRWSLGRLKKKDDTIPQRICDGCTQPYEAFYKLCPYQLTPRCAEPYTPQLRAARSAPEQVDGDLFELDVETMRALFARISASNMSDDDFVLDMVDRDVPQIARGKQLRHHKAGVHRRKVLLNLMGWWVGAQPGRPLDEVHRRFYLRFGVDIGSAQALNMKDTDALIETIARRFNEDLAA